MLKRIHKLGRQRLWLAHREYLRAKHELKYLFWECTLNCNFKCRHCGSRAGEHHIPETLSTAEIKAAFADVAKHFDARKITIAVTGGEPLLRKDLFEVMTYASSLGFRWGMVSNGSLVTPQIVEQAKLAGMRTADISIDGIGATHDAFRQTPGSYEKAVNAVRLFLEADFLRPLRITTTVHRANFHQLDEMYATFSGLGIKDWRLLSVEPIGRTIDNRDLLLTPDEFRSLLQFIKQKRAERAKVKLTYGCAHFLGEELEDEVRDHFFYCGTGINIGSILHNGDIFVCPNVPRHQHLIQGNVKRDSLATVWQHKFQAFRDQNRTSCESCTKCDHWQECLGGSFHAWDFEQKRPKLCAMSEPLYAVDK